jgi:hypothetical protein
VSPALPLPDKPSIAVLPFANMSGDPEQEYFADGMVEEIITALSRIRRDAMGYDAQQHSPAGRQHDRVVAGQLFDRARGPRRRSWPVRPFDGGSQVRD